jgi:hypothetical protein
MGEYEIDQELVEELKQSKQRFGALSPIILDAKGNIVEGHHRNKADSDWPKVTYKEIKTEEDQILYAIAFNWHRREKAESWKTRMLGKLASLGYTVDQIAERTSLNKRTVYRYLPSDLKGPEPKELEEARLSRDSLSRNLKPQDMSEGQIREFLDNPKVKEIVVAMNPSEFIPNVDESTGESIPKPTDGSEPSHPHPNRLEGIQVHEFHCSECDQTFFIDHISPKIHKLHAVREVS